MKIEIDSQDILEIEFEEFKLFYPLFNSGEKVLWYKDKEDKYILLAFIDGVATMCIVTKEDIIKAANLPDLYPETQENAVNEWRQQFLIGQAPQMLARPFKRFGNIE